MAAYIGCLEEKKITLKRRLIKWKKLMCNINLKYILQSSIYIITAVCKNFKWI